MLDLTVVVSLIAQHLLRSMPAKHRTVSSILERSAFPMSSHRKQLELDARWVYWRSFLLFFVVCQLLVWHRVQRIPFRQPGRRLLVFLMAPWATIRSFVIALFAGGIVTLAAILFVNLIARPLIRRWLSPAVDPTEGQFHLGAAERVVASLSARRQTGWTWQPGSLTLTDRRLWFFPAAWELEPWSLGVDELDQIKPEPFFLAELAPIRNWPLPMQLWGRSGQEALFAMSEPDRLLDWFGEFKQVEGPKNGNAARREGGELDG
jgi:hypothetical protein